MRNGSKADTARGKAGRKKGRKRREMPVSFRIDRKLAMRGREVAAVGDRSFSAWIRHLMREAIAAHDKAVKATA